MNHIKVLFFATLRDRAGLRSIELDIPKDLCLRDLKDRLLQDFPGLGASMETVVISINREFVSNEEMVIPENAEIAMFPPVSGG